MTMTEFQRRLYRATDLTGGRYRFGYSPGDDPECYLWHIRRPAFWAQDQWFEVGKGDLADCLEALDRYVAQTTSALIAAE